MNYQRQLTKARRDAMWRTLERSRRSCNTVRSDYVSLPVKFGGVKRQDQLEFSLLVLAFLCAVGILSVVIGLSVAAWQGILAR